MAEHLEESAQISRAKPNMWYGIAGSPNEFWWQRKDAESHDIATLNIFRLQIERNDLSVPSKPITKWRFHLNDSQQTKHLSINIYKLFLQYSCFQRYSQCSQKV